METTLISKCCRVEVHTLEPEYRVEYAYECSKCHKQCEVEEVCAICFGTGEVTTYETVYPGEPHVAPIGTGPCVCQEKRQRDVYDDTL